MSVTGQCLCGDAKYVVSSDPMVQIICYCTDCQTVSGAGGYAAYIVPLDSITLNSGALATYEKPGGSGSPNQRRFCTRCGTRMWAELPDRGIASLNGLTLDDKSLFQPMGNHMVSSKPDWCQLNEALPEM